MKVTFSLLACFLFPFFPFREITSPPQLSSEILKREELSEFFLVCVWSGRMGIAGGERARIEAEMTWRS